MKFPKWYNTNNFFGFLLLAGEFNPDYIDKHTWTFGKTFAVIILDILLFLNGANVLFRLINLLEA